MLAILPALNFMRDACGSYRSEDPPASLRIWPCGYGVAIDLADERKTKMVGVIGADGNGVECFMQFGLPNVIRLTGQLDSKQTIRLAAAEPVIDILISRGTDGLRFSFSLQDREQAAYTFVRA